MPSTKERLRFLIFGAGAIGTYVGGSLALVGHPVVFLERPKVAEDLRQRGLRLNLTGQETHIPSPTVTGSIEEALDLGPFQAAVFALKSYDTASALEDLRPHWGTLPPILGLQNGVDNEPALEAALSSDKVIPGTLTSAIRRRAAGDIVLERLRGIGIFAGHPLSIPLSEAMERAGLKPHLYPNAKDMKWSKMLTNLLANATSAILDMTPVEVFAHEELYRLEIAQLCEALAVMRAQGIHTVDLPSAPVRLLAFGVQYTPMIISRPLLQRAVGGGRGDKMPSFHIDLHSGSGKSEVDYLNGAVVRYGERSSIPTPVNRLLTETLLRLTRGELDQKDYTRKPEKLLAQLD